MKHRNIAMIIATITPMSVATIVLAGMPLRYLPPTPVTFPGSQITNYGNIVHFDQAVTDDAKNIAAGMIRFDYTHTLEVETNPPPPNTPTWGGAALAGGLVLNENVAVKDGFSLAWVQTVNADIAGANAVARWGVTANNPDDYPDAGHPTPAYAGASLPAGANNPNPMPDFAFQDFPRRTFASGDQSWLAQLGLTCISNGTDGEGFREVRVVDTFLWGFNINQNGDGNLTLADVSAFTPSFWSDPTQGYLDTLNNAYDGMPGVKHKFASNSNCFQVVPEPGTLLLFCPGVVALLIRRRG